jgi:hypothetical protein
MRTGSWFFFFLLLLLPVTIYAEYDWRLVKDDEGIRAYTRAIPGSPLVACKVVCEIEAPLEAVRELLLDTSTTTRWYHHCKECRELRRDKDGRELLYYFVFQGIWPVADRDLVVSIRITRNDGDAFICQTAALGGSSGDYVPLNKSYVRVTDSVSTFRLTKTGRCRTLLVHETMTDPSGMVPAFLVNRYMARVPFLTLRNMRVFLNNTDKYYKMAGIPKDM